MGLPGPDGLISVYVATALDSAPAVSLATDIGGATDITPDLYGAALPDVPQSMQTTDISDVSSAFRKTDLGTYGGDQGSFEILTNTDRTKRVAAPVLVRGFRGLLLFARWGGSGALAADHPDGTPVQYKLLTTDDWVEVIPIAVGAAPNVRQTTNMPPRKLIQYAITGTPYEVQVTA